ncbi:SapC family protein [Methylobacterium sp. SyP6R]|uniref:SapC family protein n=1 Tax=Methylobacterium sp. SyP6R TaxID=2718876 RepID=UPI001F363567|nr:SapC family protein [Methylobacterium sp. SyP6R]MCF4130231.1 SapC family protein [Methylobacterium sp. SyP6R]
MSGTVRALQHKDPARLHPLTEYNQIGEKLLVPIVAIETRALSHHYPLVWRRAAQGYELTALISLSAPHKTSLDEEIARGVPLPLLIEAYPLSVAPGRFQDSRGVVLIEDCVESFSTAGTPVFMDNGAPSSEAARRLRALEVVTSDYARTAAYSRALADHGLLIDWPLRLQIGDEGIEIEGLCVLIHPLGRGEAMKTLVAEHGFPFAELVTLHDLSLFNMQRLVDRHRRARSAHADAGARPTPEELGA